MSQCDYLIGAYPSTYSGWASFYGKVPLFSLYGTNFPELESDFQCRSILDNYYEESRHSIP